ncbi:hypothetical protein Focb16_v008181 [Fusarium oxysporum f. sp. cubense]|uniref:Azaphilone pigments biosynthesis cluster protein L N-terminal domain-containing protein n=1 Tax=Fusarium oxysporum f. sp. cubense TaxID=61366 RepID=A0A559LWN1_FUSOC|nr:hypothetical protein Focb16_v008181 [Fusarium oxysporum f. sp. cubense]
MADGLSIASSVVALVAFAFKSSTTPYTSIRDFQSQDKNARALKNELVDLRRAEPPVQDEPEWMAMLEEKQSTQEDLRICSQLSAQIEPLESSSKEHPQFLQQPSAHKFIRSGLGGAKGSIQSLVLRLQTHEHDIDNRMEAMRSAVPLSEQQATQLAQLQEAKESLRQCISVVADAGEALSTERCNIFEDITMADSSYGISVSTVKDLVIARRLNLSGQARYLGGQISDESYQRTIDGLTQLDLESFKSSGQGIAKTPSANGLRNGGVVSHGFERYGRGFKLPEKQSQTRSILSWRFCFFSLSGGRWW